MKKKRKSFRNFHKNFIKKVLPILYFIWKMNGSSKKKKQKKKKLTPNSLCIAVWIHTLIHIIKYIGKLTAKGIFQTK
jgi:hypothetical protein